MGGFISPLFLYVGVFKMIHKRKIYFILALILLINFVAIPKKSNAVALSLGSIYGTTLGTKILAFILSCAAVGVTFDALEEAEKMFDKWQMDSNNWEPPGDGDPDRNWSDLVESILGGAMLGDRIPSLFNSIKDFFQSFGSIEGDNDVISLDDDVISLDDIVFVPYNDLIKPSSTGKTYTLYNSRDSGLTNVTVSYKSLSFTVIVDETQYDGLNPSVINKPFYRITVIENGDVFKTSGYGSFRISLVKTSINKLYFQLSKGVSTAGSTSFRTSSIYDLLDINGIDSSYDYKSDTIKFPDTIKFNVKPNSSVLTDTLPVETSRPQIDIVPLEITATPEGVEQTVYPGTMENLVDDMVNTVTFDDLQNLDSTTPYSLTETEKGVIVTTDSQTGTVITPTPYPYPNQEPIEDASEFQGKNIGLLETIINWLKLIWESIQKFFEMPEDLTLDTSKLRLSDFQLKFPFSIPWDLHKAISVFAKEPTNPNLSIDIGTENLQVYEEIDLSSIDLPLRFARYVASIFFIIFLANKTRDLIKW